MRFLRVLASRVTLDYFWREIRHTSAHVVLIIVISVGTDLAGITSFGELAWEGMFWRGIGAGATVLVLAAKRWRDYLKQPSDAAV